MSTQNTEYPALAEYTTTITGIVQNFECIFAYQTEKESGCWSIEGRPLTLSGNAKTHYGVSTFEEMIGKSISFLRRKKDENGKYLSPPVWNMRKSKINAILDVEYGIKFATVTVEDTEDGTVKEMVRVNRICIA